MPSNHVEFTREMRQAGYTILVPNMLEFHFLIVKVPPQRLQRRAADQQRPERHGRGS